MKTAMGSYPVHLAEDVAPALEGDFLLRGNASHDDADPELRWILDCHAPILAVV